MPVQIECTGMVGSWHGLASIAGDGRTAEELIRAGRLATLRHISPRPLYSFEPMPGVLRLRSAFWMDGQNVGSSDLPAF